MLAVWSIHYFVMRGKFPIYPLPYEGCSSVFKTACSCVMFIILLCKKKHSKKSFYLYFTLVSVIANSQLINTYRRDSDRDLGISVSAYIWSTRLSKFEKLVYSWKTFSDYLKYVFFSQREYQISLNYFIKKCQNETVIVSETSIKIFVFQIIIGYLPSPPFLCSNKNHANDLKWKCAPRNIWLNA